jgi:hypothetical protein
MVLAILAIVFFPFLVFAVQFGKRQRIRQAQKMEAYRLSPESHILHLND